MAVNRYGRLATVTVLTAGVLTAGLSSTALAAQKSPAKAAASTKTTTVVVMAAPGREAQVQRAAVRLGAKVTHQLGIINGFSARMSAAARVRLMAVPGVVSVTPDSKVKPQSIVGSLGYDPTSLGSPSSVAQVVGAQSAWASGITGKGVDVAVIDTGVARVPGLSVAGKVVDGPDLSFDQVNATGSGVDAYGHGTFMAGIIAGRDATATTSATGCTTCLNSSGYSDTTKYVGIAPDARVINVKVGAADGATDVSQVIAAIDWVTQHAHDPGMNIRVINLSFGTDSAQAYTIDPLAQAAEQAWKHGVVVVAAAGNEGKSTKSLADPAYDPYVLAVGGDDPNGTLATTNDEVPKFAQHGTSARTVDVIAPATHVIGLRVPGSYVDSLSTNTGRVGTRFQLGSGTSEATAVVSGVVALLAQKYPQATPDQIKALLNKTATPLPHVGGPQALQPTVTGLVATLDKNVAVLNSLNALYSGHGIANGKAALATALPAGAQYFTSSTGSGTLDGSRGGVFVVDKGVNLTGQKDIFGRPFDSAAMALSQTRATTWSGGVWNGSRWSGDGWSGSRWSTAGWTGSDWAGVAWSGSRWSGMTWDGARWTGSGWSGSRWSGAGWDGSRWSSDSWN